MQRRDSTAYQLDLPLAMQLPGALDTPVTRSPLRVAGLFAGIGGFELGLSRAGHITRLLCENDPAARAVLQHRMPDVELHDDVRTLRALPADIDMLAAGFPCQDLSQAGKTMGIAGARSGLVGEVFRLIREHKTPWVLLENVPFMLHLSKGRAMDVIVETLSTLGYRWAYRVVNSRAFGVPQRRERVIFLASLHDDPRDVLFADDAGEMESPQGTVGTVACGFYWTEGNRGLGWAVDAVPTLKGGSSLGIPSPPAIVMPNGDIVKPDIRDAERLQGFDVDWTAPAESVARASSRWKLVGNAVTVQVAHWIGMRLRSPSDVGRHLSGTRLERKGTWPRVAWDVGNGIHTGELSAYPVRNECANLDKWLRYKPHNLSAKATAGFLARITASSLRYPKSFPKALRAHLKKLEREAKLSNGPMTRGQKKPGPACAPQQP